MSALFVVIILLIILSTPHMAFGMPAIGLIPLLLYIGGLVIAWKIAFDWIAPNLAPPGWRNLVGLIIFFIIFKWVVALVFAIIGVAFAGIMAPVFF